MTTFSALSHASLAAAPSATNEVSRAINEKLSDLYRIAERSLHVFGSPAGPIQGRNGRLHFLPRFVYFGASSANAALRLAFYAGLDHRDLRSTLALLKLVEGLALRPDLGQALNLSFFPLVDVLGLAHAVPHRDLATANWATSTAPELQVLERDTRLRGYDGFIRLESVASDTINIQLRSPQPSENAAPELEIIASTDVDPFDVRWESVSGADLRSGPLSLADDLPVQPFELVVGIPGSWSTELYAESAALILKRFVVRHRGFISYAQHL